LAIATVSLAFSQKTSFITVELFDHDFTIFVLCVFFGVLIDIDHILDYRLNRHYYHEGLESRYEKGKMCVIFHGMENTIVLTILSVAYPFLIFPTISYTIHMTMDIMGNDVPARAYLYTIRFCKILTQAHTRKQ